MRWINAYRIRKLLKTGGLTYESSQRIMARKGLDFVHYLRSRRTVSESAGSALLDQYEKNRRYSRRQHLLRSRTGVLVQPRLDARGSGQGGGFPVSHV